MILLILIFVVYVNYLLLWFLVHHCLFISLARACNFLTLETKMNCLRENGMNFGLYSTKKRIECLCHKHKLPLCTLLHVQIVPWSLKRDNLAFELCTYTVCQFSIQIINIVNMCALWLHSILICKETFECVCTKRYSFKLPWRNQFLQLYIMNNTYKITFNFQNLAKFWNI